jgi:hypothetical protein
MNDVNGKDHVYQLQLELNFYNHIMEVILSKTEQLRSV